MKTCQHNQNIPLKKGTTKVMGDIIYICLAFKIKPIFKHDEWKKIRCCFNMIPSVSEEL